MNANSLPVLPEDPTVVTGGPLDPTSPEGQPPEELPAARSVSPAGEAPASTQAPSELTETPILDDHERLRIYTQQLEKELQIRQQAAQSIPENPIKPLPAPAQTAKQKFSEKIFSNPDEAFEIAVGEATERMNQSRAQEQRITDFWGRFYSRNPQLKAMNRVVQSVLRENSVAISKFASENEVIDFLSKETQDVINMVKKESGFTETSLPSKPAVTLGGSREPVPQRPLAPPQSLNFMQQIRRLKPVGKKS